MRLASQHRPRTERAIEMTGFATSTYNVCCTVIFEDGFRALVRFPIRGRSQFRREKCRNEATVMKFLSRNTTIPVPLILGEGLWGCGPFFFFFHDSA